MSKYLDFLQTSTNTRINDRWLLKNSELQKIVSQVSPSTKFKNFNETNPGDFRNQHTNLAQQGFLYIVPETVYRYPTTFISEKQIKPILSKRPFVTVGPVNSLKNLRSIGFKTFGDFWDESYDTIDNLEDRLLSVVNIIEWVCSQSVQDLQNLCIEMQDVLNYNFKFYVTEFKDLELQKLKDTCIDNLKERND